VDPSVRVYVDTTELCRVIEGFEERLNACNPEGIIAETVVTAIDDLIQSQGNGNWPFFSPVTFKVHPDRIGGKLLQGPTGQLANVQPESRPGLATVTSPAPYAQYQQEGTSITWGLIHSRDGIPARDFMGIDLVSTLEDACGLIVQEVVR